MTFVYGDVLVVATLDGSGGGLGLRGCPSHNHDGGCGVVYHHHHSSKPDEQPFDKK
jgi:hypothetical protein